MEVKVEAVHGDQFWEQHCLQLLLTLQAVTKHKAAFLAGVGVQVNVDLDLALLRLLLDCFFNGPNSGLVHRRRIDVVSI